jgi:hypothetical protein
VITALLPAGIPSSASTAETGISVASKQPAIGAARRQRTTC